MSCLLDISVFKFVQLGTSRSRCGSSNFYRFTSICRRNLRTVPWIHVEDCQFVGDARNLLVERNCDDFMTPFISSSKRDLLEFLADLTDFQYDY